MKQLLRWCGALVVLLVVLLGLALAAVWAPDIPVAQLTARWAPPPSQFVDIDGLQVHLRDEGPRDDPQPIVLLHGTSASLHTWDGWAQSLGASRRVIRMDMPGFGLTGPNAQDDYRISAYTQFVLKVMDRLGVQRAVLAGNSLGGEIAWRVALQQPQRVSHLVLIDSIGYPLNAESIPLGFRLARVPVVNRLLEHVLPRTVVAQGLKDVYGDPGKVTEALIDRYVELTRRAGNRRALPLRLAQEMGKTPEAIQTITTPTLILWGQRDRLVPVETAHWFARDIAGSTLVVFERLGHVPQEEDPQATVAALQQFLGGR